MSKDTHSCGYHCHVPACVKAQRDQLVKEIAGLEFSLKEAHKRGFLRAAGWMQQDHLFADVDSPTYIKDRDADLAAITQKGKTP